MFMARDRDLLKIGEFAQLADTSVRTLRYYEEFGLLRPARRGRGGVRYFDRIQLDRITAIERLQRLGLSLEWMARTLFDNDGVVDGLELLARVRAGLRQQIVLTRLRSRSLHVDLQELEEAYQRLAEQCDACDIPFSRDNCDPCPGDEEPLSSVVRALL
jgi:DNA-binding transcriptional MerR regulator